MNRLAIKITFYLPETIYWHYSDSTTKSDVAILQWNSIEKVIRFMGAANSMKAMATVGAGKYNLKPNGYGMDV